MAERRPRFSRVRPITRLVCAHQRLITRRNTRSRTHKECNNASSCPCVIFQNDYFFLGSTPQTCLFFHRQTVKQRARHYYSRPMRVRVQHVYTYNARRLKRERRRRQPPRRPIGDDVVSRRSLGDDQLTRRIRRYDYPCTNKLGVLRNLVLSRIPATRYIGIGMRSRVYLSVIRR